MSRGVLAIVALALVAAGCGEREYAPALGDVVLSIDGPADAAAVDAETVEVRGRVQPADARVLVDGEAVAVSGGAFTATVALDAGANVIDVQAAAPRRPAAMQAVRVTRRVRVPVPFVEGQTTEAALEELEGAGFETAVEDVSGFLDALIDDEPGVCGTEPEAGTELLPGETVTVFESPRCSE